MPADIPTILTACEHKPSISRLADLILEHQPEAIFTHNCAAANSEHFATALLVANAYDEAQKNGYRGLLLQWLEVAITVHGRLNSLWNTFVDITGYEQERMDLIALHACQIPDTSRIGLRMLGPICGCGEAEVFMLIKGDFEPERPSLAAELLDNLK